MEDTTPFLVCKICECQISTAIFQGHIKSCKDLAELKQQVLHYQSKLSTHVSRAYDLRNQLNTNFAMEKKKHERRNSKAERSPSPTPDKIHSVHIHREFLFDKEPLNYDLSPASANKKISKPFLTVSTGLGKKLQDYEDEMCKTLNALKAITQYGHNALSDPAEVNIDLITDLKVRNEVNLMYLEIKDKQISEYIEKFIKIIQKLIKDKQAYIKKQEESQKIMCKTIDTLQIPLVNIPNMVSPRPGRLLSLDDGDVSDLSSERKKRKSICNPPTTIWIRRASVGNPGLQSKLVLGTPTDVQGEDENRKVNRQLSKFASPMLAKHNSAVVSPGTTTAKTLINKFEKGVVIKGKIPVELKEAMLNISQITFRFEDRLKKVQEMPKRNSKKSREQSPMSGGLSHRKVQIKRNVTVYMDKLERKTPKQRQSDMAAWGGDNENNDNGDGKKKIKKFQKIFSMDQLFQKKKAPEDPVAKVVVSKTAKKLPSQESEEKPLSRGQLTPSCSGSSSSFTNSMASISEKDDQQENQADENHQDFPVLTNRGYYSDSEINDMKSTTEQSQRKFEVTIEDFQFIKFLGEGAFGKVYLVKKRKTGDIYAMKIVDSADRETTHNKIASLRAERDAYKSIKGDWVVKAFYTLSYQSYVCFVIEYMLGGDLEGLLEQAGCFEEPSARFYFAELVLAVESLHNLGIIHRDLKPDNVLIDGTGHIKLTDFGLSEQGIVKIINQSSTFQMLSRGNSLIDSNALGLSAGFGMFPITEKKESILTQKDGECESQELTSGGDNLNSPDSMQFPDGISVKKEMSTHSDRFSPDGDEPYIIKNKIDEEVVFSCLVGEEQRLGWMMKKNRLGASNLSTNSKKKEVHRIVGTPDYMAPEIIKGEDCNDQAVDLWSLGVILYELLAGVPPFNDESIDKIFGNIIQGKLEWPPIGYGDDCMTPEAEDLIKKLMMQDPKQRISIKDLKQHAFFKGFDWKNVKDMKAPFVPKKKEIDPNAALDPKNIFKVENLKLAKQASLLNEMPTFNTKRIDLLYQLNQTLYNNHLKDVASQSKEI